MKFKKLLSLVLVAALMFSLAACKTDEKNENANEGSGSKVEISKERSETMFVTGLWWGAPNNFNHLVGYSAFPCNTGNNPLVYETMFMYNSVSQELEPLLATGYEWIDDYTVEIKMNEDARFADGEKVTAHDVIYTYELAQRYDTPAWSSVWDDLATAEATDDYTLRLSTVKERNIHFAILDSMVNVPIHPKHIWEQIEKDADYDQGAILEFFNENPIGSGPYVVKTFDDTKITVERRDDYWGTKLFGGLAAPKFITHLDYSSNDVAALDLENGTLDYSENFVQDVSNMKGFGDTIKTYLSTAPYYTNETIPSMFINVQKAGLDNVDVRRAIAFALDYDKIADLAMTGYSVPAQAGLFVNTDASKALVDMDAIKDLQWNYNVDKANEILDSIGAKKGDDGIRVLEDGTRLGPWKIAAPAGWTEYNVAAEVVVQNAKAIGIEIVTDFTDWQGWYDGQTLGTFDFTIEIPAGFVTPANPWTRYQYVLSSVGVAPVDEATYTNFGRYHSDDANAVIEAIPHAKNDAELKELYTEANKIFLRDVPMIPLMYRPYYYYTANESVWTGFSDDKSGLPPYIFVGAGIKLLYNLENK